MADEVTEKPTGHSKNWDGIVFDQYQIMGDPRRGFEGIFRMRGHEHLAIEFTRGGHIRAGVNGTWLPTKFRRSDTAARALKKHMGDVPK